MIVMNNLWGAVMDMHAGVRRLREATYSKETQSQTGPTKTRPNIALHYIALRKAKQQLAHVTENSLMGCVVVHFIASCFIAFFHSIT